MQFNLDKNEKYVLFKLNEQKLNTLIAADMKSELLILNTQGVKNIILDLSETKFCDSSGLSAILTGNRLCRNVEGSFILTGVNEHVNKLIHISQLDQVLTLIPTVDEAIEYVFMDEIERDISDTK
ncbi:MAG TPA: STAS domain-containing protein [Bacteroidia bacterium]|nr:STAS domain-containing protein [Bacteroidia bacterium]HNT79623.1 STAS domain-containing protein [Bacteroidia bacterium]